MKGGPQGSPPLPQCPSPAPCLPGSCKAGPPPEQGPAGRPAAVSGWRWVSRVRQTRGRERRLGTQNGRGSLRTGCPRMCPPAALSAGWRHLPAWPTEEARKRPAARGSRWAVSLGKLGLHRGEKAGFHFRDPECWGGTPSPDSLKEGAAEDSAKTSQRRKGAGWKRAVGSGCRHRE